MFVCPGCKARFRVTKAPKSGRIKCPKCGLVSVVRARGEGALEPDPGDPRAAEEVVLEAADPVSAEPAAVAKPGAAPDLAPGAVIAGHQILEYIGGSEFCAAYKAAQTSMGRTVLFKMLRPKYAPDAAIRARFFAGARGAAKLNHPNLLSVFDMGEGEDACFFTTEFVDGGTLPEFLRREKHISSEQRLSIATQIAQALAYAESSGVGHTWLRAEDVLLTEKGDVRVSHVGTGAPLNGGSPEPTMDALARLVYLVAAGRALALEAARSGDAGALALPTAKDALGTQLNALVARLVKEKQAAFENVGAFAAELQKLSESVQRRGTVHAAASPGGVVPLRLERARRRELPIKAIAVLTVIIAGIGAIVLFAVLNSVHTKEREKGAAELWAAADVQLLNKQLEDALATLQKLAKQYPDTELGRRAATEEINKVRTGIVAREYKAAEAKFEDKPRDVAEATAAITSAREKLERQFPGLALVGEQEKIRLGNIQKHYANAAVHEWNETMLKKIEGYVGRMQFGQALADVEAFGKRWPGVTRVQDVIAKMIVTLNTSAQERYDEVTKSVDKLLKEDKQAEAEATLGRAIRNFGITEYVEKFQKKLKDMMQPEP